MAGLSLMVFFSMEAGNPFMPCAHTLLFSVLWLWGAADSPRGWHGRKIMAWHGMARGEWLWEGWLETWHERSVFLC